MPSSALIKLLGLPLAGLCAVSLSLWASTWSDFLPSPRATWDMDRTILATKTDMARETPTADLVLIGDSSCMMNINTELLQAELDLSILNLGTLSFLDLPSIYEFLQELPPSSGSIPKAVVWLTHPEFLRRHSPSPIHVEWLNSYREGADFSYRSGTQVSLPFILGSHLAEGRILAWLPRPLSGAFRNQYGFNLNLEAYLRNHHGAAIDPRELSDEDLRGSTDYRLSKTNREAAQDIANSWNRESVVIVGLTPVPESFGGRRINSIYDEMLNTWKESLSADHALSELPATYQDAYFATKTHLNREGARIFTSTLAEALTSILGQDL